METKEEFNINSFEELRLKLAERNAKMTKAICISSGVVASLSSLIVAGNIVIDNYLPALQVGGSTFALAAMSVAYMKKMDIAKKELEEIKNPTLPSKDVLQDLINKLQGYSEKYELDKNMGYLVSSGFMASAIANIHQIIMAPNAGVMGTQIALAALASIMSFLNLKLALHNSRALRSTKTNITELEKSQQQLQEALAQANLKGTTNDIVDEPKVLELTDKPRTK